MTTKLNFSNLPASVIDPSAFYPVHAAAPLVFRAAATLDTLRSKGGGPRYSKRGRIVLYRGQALIDWLAGGPEFEQTAQDKRLENRPKTNPQEARNAKLKPEPGKSEGGRGGGV